MPNHRIGIIGLGYVGLPLAIEFCRAGLEVVGVDTDNRRIAALRLGGSYIEDVSPEQVHAAVSAGRLFPTTDYHDLRDVESISICVPTPLGKSRDPDMTYVTQAAHSLGAVLQRGQIVILESTVYPGATEEVVAPILQESGLTPGADFYLAFSPERIDPGNKEYSISQTPKLVGGVNEESTRRAAEMYGQVFPCVLPLDSTREAEMAKLLENTFRAVNIGLINELALVAHNMGIDIWKVIEAASTKPYGFMPFYPGPGWGGHCIPVDPFYLSWCARVNGFEVGFIDQAGRINNKMPSYVAERVNELLNSEGKCLKDARILILGVAYKRDVADVRESPALAIMELLERQGAHLSYHDPHVERLSLKGCEWVSQSLEASTLENQDCVVIVTDHHRVDYEFVAQHSSLVFDARNATASLRKRYPQISVL